MRTFGLVGFPLEHSFSPGYFAEKFLRENIDDAIYKLFPLEDISRLRPMLASGTSIVGLNVTIPHKENAFMLMDEIDLNALRTKAVNCIRINRKAKKMQLIGCNTDVIGFEKSLLPALGKHHDKALVLGTGGASKSVRFVLKKLGIPFLLVSRTAAPGMLGYDALTKEILSKHPLIINTTPLGMFPDEGSMPALPYDFIGNGHFLYDLIYNPAETAFLAEGKKRGAMVKNGLEMLEIQAEESWKIWNA